MEGQGKLRALLLLITSSFIYYTILSFVIPIIEDDIHPTSILLTIFPSKHVASKLAITQDTTCNMCYNPVTTMKVRVTTMVTRIITMVTCAITILTRVITIVIRIVKM